MFGYEINILSDHKNLVYASTQSEYQRVMQWRRIMEGFGTKIQHITGVDNIISDVNHSVILNKQKSQD